MKKLLYFLLFSIFYLFEANAQETFPINGVKDVKPNLYAFINAKAVTNPGTTIENATILVNNGLIQSIGAGIAAPKGAVVIDCKGKTIYPSFIDIYTFYQIKMVRTIGTKQLKQSMKQKQISA
jgi:adenine deaminase